MTLKATLTFMSFAAIIAGCDAVETASQPIADQPSAPTSAGKTVVGDARMASFSAPKSCERVSLDTMRTGGSTRVRSGCIVRSGDATVVVGLNEITVPFNQAFSVSGGGADDFQQAAAAFPREMLSEYLVEVEKSALASNEPGWRYSNKKSNLLPGNGGVNGASACVQFSFNGVSTGAPPQKSNVTGLRCARFGKSANTVQEVMLEVISFYPSNQNAPGNYRSISEQAKNSLRFR